MSDIRDLAALKEVVEARYQFQQQALSTLVAEENALRAELTKLDNQMREAEAQSDPQMRAIGADIMWKAWVGRAKSELNLRLARVLGRKDQIVRQVRLAYGKVVVTEELLASAKDALNRKKAKDGLDRAVEQALFGIRGP